jgi:predicted outer membrane protein
MQAFFRQLILLSTLPILSRAQYGPKVEPAAMSSNYNPLLWRGDDAKFALETIRSSYCSAEISKTVAAKTSNQAVQNLALTTAYDQGRIFEKIRNMAKTFEFSLPPKREIRECPATERLKELEGHDLDSAYLAFLQKTSVENVFRFESEVQLPRVPSNWSLWAFAQKNLPIMREDAATVANVQQSTGVKK